MSYLQYHSQVERTCLPERMAGCIDSSPDDQHAPRAFYGRTEATDVELMLPSMQHPRILGNLKLIGASPETCRWFRRDNIHCESILRPAEKPLMMNSCCHPCSTRGVLWNLEVFLREEEHRQQHVRSVSECWTSAEVHIRCESILRLAEKPLMTNSCCHPCSTRGSSGTSKCCLGRRSIVRNIWEVYLERWEDTEDL